MPLLCPGCKRPFQTQKPADEPPPVLTLPPAPVVPNLSLSDDPPPAPRYVDFELSAPSPPAEPLSPLLPLDRDFDLVEEDPPPLDEVEDVDDEPLPLPEVPDLGPRYADRDLDVRRRDDPRPPPRKPRRPNLKRKPKRGDLSRREGDAVVTVGGATTSLIFGVASVLTCCVVFLGLPLGAVGYFLADTAMKDIGYRDANQEMLYYARLLSLGGMVLSLCLFVLGCGVMVCGGGGGGGR